MPIIEVRTVQRVYPAVVQYGALDALGQYLPPKAGKLFVITTEDVWRLYGERVERALSGHCWDVLFFPGGEERKRLSEVEILAEQMVEKGGDRSSVVVAFGGGIVNDVGGFLAATFMRGVPVIQVPTTLLAQVDAGVGGKTGVNLTAGKNLIGAFHQPIAVLIDPGVLQTLPEREYRAGLYEVLKTGVIRNERLFETMERHVSEILAREPEILEEIVARSVEVKAEVVSADERESDLRRILNFGHTLGHALEAETGYSVLLHGEAVAFGMRAATRIAMWAGYLGESDGRRILSLIDRYGPIPPVTGIRAENLVTRLRMDKKTIQGTVHFVLPVRIGDVVVVSGLPEELILRATEVTLSEIGG